MLLTGATALAVENEAMRKRIAGLEAALRNIRTALAPSTIKTDPALLDDPFEWIDNVAREALGE